MAETEPGVILSVEREKSELPTPEGCHILEIWNDPRDEASSIARARVPAGTTTRLHLLRGVDERYLVISGQGSARAGERDGIPLSAGDVLVIPAGVSQQATALGSEDLVFYCVCTPRFTPDCYRALQVDE